MRQSSIQERLLGSGGVSTCSCPREEFGELYVTSSIDMRWAPGRNWMSLGCVLEHEFYTIQQFFESPHRHFRCCIVAPRWGFNAAPLRRMSFSWVVQVGLTRMAREPPKAKF